MLAGVSVVNAAPVATSAVAPATISQAAPSQAPMSKDEMKRRRKMKKNTGPEVYKGTVAEQSRIVTDAPGAEKEDEGSKKERKAKKN